MAIAATDGLWAVRSSAEVEKEARGLLAANGGRVGKGMATTLLNSAAAAWEKKKEKSECAEMDNSSIIMISFKYFFLGNSFN